jgi:hypothetical protein
VGEDGLEWLGPSLGQQCGEVPMQTVVARGDTAVVVLDRARVFREGCALDYTLAARLNRPGASSRDRGAREQLHDVVNAGNPGAPVFTVEFADGTSSSTADTIALGFDPDPRDPPRPPVLHPTIGGSATTDGRLLERNQSLWLWPLPAPDRAATVRIDWADYRISGATHALDVEALLAAAARVRALF